MFICSLTIKAYYVQLFTGRREVTKVQWESNFGKKYYQVKPAALNFVPKLFLPKYLKLFVKVAKMN